MCHQVSFICPVCKTAVFSVAPEFFRCPLRAKGCKKIELIDAILPREHRPDFFCENEGCYFNQRMEDRQERRLSALASHIFPSASEIPSTPLGAATPLGAVQWRHATPITAPTPTAAPTPVAATTLFGAATPAGAAATPAGAAATPVGAAATPVGAVATPVAAVTPSAAGAIDEPVDDQDSSDEDTTAPEEAVEEPERPKILKYTKSEEDLLTQLREQGRTWRNIQENFFPDRATSALAAKYSYMQNRQKSK